MTQPNQAVFGDVEEEIRWSKAPPSTTITEHWNYDDRKDFHGGYCWMGQGPLPIEWASVQAGSRGLWGDALVAGDEELQPCVGVKMVGEAMPDENNRVTLADETDQYGLPITRIHYAWTENDKALIAHGLDQMEQSMQRGGRPQHVPAGAGRQPPRRHGPHGRRSAHERGRRRLPLLGHPEPLGLRRLGVPDRRRREPVADDPGRGAAHRRPHRGAGAARGIVSRVADRNHAATAKHPELRAGHAAAGAPQRLLSRRLGLFSRD